MRERHNWVVYEIALPELIQHQLPDAKAKPPGKLVGPY